MSKFKIGDRVKTHGYFHDPSEGIVVGVWSDAASVKIPTYTNPEFEWCYADEKLELQPPDLPLTHTASLIDAATAYRAAYDAYVQAEVAAAVASRAMHEAQASLIRIARGEAIQTEERTA